MFPHQFVRVSIRRIWRKVKEPKAAAKTCNECLGLLRNMGWTAVNDEENTALGADHQPPKKLDENLGVDAAFFLDHEPHMAARSHRRDETHAVPRPGTQDNRCLSLLAPGPAGMMIRAHSVVNPFQLLAIKFRRTPKQWFGLQRSPASASILCQSRVHRRTIDANNASHHFRTLAVLN